MTPTMQAIFAALSGKRFPLEHEAQTQNSIWSVLTFAQSDGRLARDLRLEREVWIAGGRIDFIVGDVGLEIKIKGQAAAIVRQLRGYANEPALCGLVLATSKPVHLGMIGSKPVAVFDIARAWL